MPPSAGARVESREVLLAAMQTTKPLEFSAFPTVLLLTTLMRLSLNGNASAAGAASATRLKKMLEPYRNGNCPVAIHYENDGGIVDMRLPDDWRVSPDDNLLKELRSWLQPENVEVLFS